MKLAEYASGWSAGIMIQHEDAGFRTTRAKDGLRADTSGKFVQILITQRNL